jgi:hypothetical protein
MGWSVEELRDVDLGDCRLKHAAYYPLKSKRPSTEPRPQADSP